MNKIQFKGETLTPSIGLYSVTDFMGEDKVGLALELYLDGEPEPEGFPYTDLTVSFGEFIGIKNAAYIDSNNNPKELIDAVVEAGWMQDTGFTKASGFCIYPLYTFSEDFLKSVDPDVYREYSGQYEDPEREMVR